MTRSRSRFPLPAGLITVRVTQTLIKKKGPLAIEGFCYIERKKIGSGTLGGTDVEPEREDCPRQGRGTTNCCVSSAARRTACWRGLSELGLDSWGLVTARTRRAPRAFGDTDGRLEEMLEQKEGSVKPSRARERQALYPSDVRRVARAIEREQRRARWRRARSMRSLSIARAIAHIKRALGSAFVRRERRGSAWVFLADPANPVEAALLHVPPCHSLKELQAPLRVEVLRPELVDEQALAQALATRLPSE